MCLTGKALGANSCPKAAAQVSGGGPGKEQLRRGLRSSLKVRVWGLCVVVLLLPSSSTKSTGWRERDVFPSQ